MTKTYKFKKGDRVRFTGESEEASHGCLVKGSVGTVAQDQNSCPWVSWDTFTGGHDYATNDGSVNQWAADEDDLELIEAPATSFQIGQRVRVTDDYDNDYGREGVVVEGNYPQHIAVMLDGADHKSYWAPEDLESVEPAKPEVYVTAWVYDDGFAHTIDPPFETKEAADARAKQLVSDRPETVAVLKMVSKHSSAVTVTSEDV